jgi:hypothetical protein
MSQIYLSKVGRASVPATQSGQGRPLYQHLLVFSRHEECPPGFCNAFLRHHIKKRASISGKKANSTLQGVSHHVAHLIGLFAVVFENTGLEELGEISPGRFFVDSEALLEV